MTTAAHEFIANVICAVTRNMPAIHAYDGFIMAYIEGLPPETARTIALNICNAIDKYRHLVKK